MIRPRGDWLIAHADEMRSALAEQKSDAAAVEIDLSETAALDTFGALLLLKTFKGKENAAPQISHANDAQRGVFDLIHKTTESLKPGKPESRPSFLERAARAAGKLPNYLFELLSFLGQSCAAFIPILRKPSLIRPRELVAHLQIASVDAIPIISLVTFLIGVVVAYLFVSQANKYGADVFISEVVSIGMFREFSPIIVAVIMAGRSGSAFTAQIGTMKMNEEIDAISTLGLSPFHVLVLPRLIAVTLAMPLLVFVGDLTGMSGGMLIAYDFLGLTPLTFLSRLHTDLCQRSFIIGLIKAPVFAVVIATIGCKLGFSVENNARSVGLNTTASVVQSVVCVIILDALFAVILQSLDL